MLKALAPYGSRGRNAHLSIATQYHRGSPVDKGRCPETAASTPARRPGTGQSRASTGAIYWEGTVTVLRDARPIGRGYLERTGYGRPLDL